MATPDLALLRAGAQQAATAHLAALGFQNTGAEWEGPVDLGTHGPLQLRVSLPDAFPDDLPIIKVDLASLPRSIPHLERSGKLCLGPTSGMLLDADNPVGIVRDALAIAIKTIQEGLDSRNLQDFTTEFLGYWGAQPSMLADCNPAGNAREIALIGMDRTTTAGLAETNIILADTPVQAEHLATILGGHVTKRRAAFFLPLATAFPPPAPNEVLTVKHTCHLLREHASADAWAALRGWLGRPVLPCVLLLSLPAHESNVLVAIRVDEIPSEGRRQSRRGFRPDRVPASRDLAFAQNQAVVRLSVTRYDAGFLLPRGRAAPSLSEKILAVIGCGAVGSHAIERLASLGIQHFRLIDHDFLQPANLYRHTLGTRHIGTNKARAMALELQARFPRIDAQYAAKDFEAVLRDDSPFVLGADLIIFATGNETLELRYNSVLAREQPRLHAWVEPLGIGGHVLATGISGQQGCFRCLFGRDPKDRFVNGAAFAAPGQAFQHAHAGCAGTFTPYAGIDADQTALAVARLAASILEERLSENVLVSWRGDDTAFVQAGYTLSARAKRFQMGDCRQITDFVKGDCPHCRSWS